MSDQTGTSAESGLQAAANSGADVDLAIAINEDGERVGLVNIDQETYEYHGAYDRIEQLLDTMENDGFERRVPADDPRDDHDPFSHSPTERIKRTGIDLAQYLPRLIEQRGRGEIDVYAEPIGYERDYEKTDLSPDDLLRKDEPEPLTD